MRKGQPSTAAMLMTSATVHAGASGGAVVAEDGSIAGLVTSNARFSASGTIIPNLNFAVAAEALKPLWALAEAPEGLTHDALQKLDVQDPALSQLWKLTAPPEKQVLSDVGEVSWSRSKETAAERLAGLLSKSGLSDLKLHDQLQAPGRLTSRL